MCFPRASNDWYSCLLAIYVDESFSRVHHIRRWEVSIIRPRSRLLLCGYICLLCEISNHTVVISRNVCLYFLLLAILIFNFSFPARSDLHLNINIFDIFDYEQNDSFMFKNLTLKEFYFTRIDFKSERYIFHTEHAFMRSLYVGFTTDHHSACVIPSCDYHE